MLLSLTINQYSCRLQLKAILCTMTRVNALLALLVLLLAAANAIGRELLQTQPVCARAGRRLYADGKCGGAGNPCCCQPVQGKETAGGGWGRRVGLRAAKVRCGAEWLCLHNACRPASLLWVLRGPRAVVPLFRFYTPWHPRRLPPALPVHPRPRGKLAVQRAALRRSAGCGPGLGSWPHVKERWHAKSSSQIASPPWALQGCGGAGQPCCPPPSDLGGSFTCSSPSLACADPDVDDSYDAFLTLQSETLS